MKARAALLIILIAPALSVDKEADLDGLAKLEPLFDYWIRDTYITYVEGDDTYYMTGTTSDPSRDFPGNNHARDFNDGIYVWKSKDLEHWASLGRVWGFEEHGTWHNEFVLSAASQRSVTGFEGMQERRRSVWAPEIHYVNGNYYIVGCMNWHPSDEFEENGRVFLLESVSGRPEGPYRDPVGKPLANRIDPSLFEDDDGTVYFIWQEGRIAKMKSDMSGFAEEPRGLEEETYPDNPDAQGVFIAKRDNLYYLVQAIWWMENGKGEQGYLKEGNRLYYDCVVSTSKNIYGPYGKKYMAIRGGGHTNLFQDREGSWWATYFGNPIGKMRPSFTARPAIIPLKFEENGRFMANWDIVVN